MSNRRLIDSRLAATLSINRSSSLDVDLLSGYVSFIYGYQQFSVNKHF